MKRTTLWSMLLLAAAATTTTTLVSKASSSVTKAFPQDGNCVLESESIATCVTNAEPFDCVTDSASDTPWLPGCNAKP